MSEDLTVWDMLLRASVALVAGVIIGIDRERQDKAAGIRTMALVSLGAAGAMMVGIQLAATFTEDSGVQLDPLRALNGVIGGIGFLGAGAIIHAGTSVRGLTTAATIWAAAGIGTAAGAGFLDLAGILAGMVLLTLIVLTWLKGPVLPDHSENDSRDDR